MHAQANISKHNAINSNITQRYITWFPWQHDVIIPRTETYIRFNDP